MGLSEKIVGKNINRISISEAWRKGQVMTLKELTKKEA